MADFATLTARVPKDVRDGFAQLAEARQTTPSALLRGLVEAELAGRPAAEVGAVEAAVAAELAARDADPGGARAQAALILARRLDRSPTAGAATSGELRRWLADLLPPEVGEFDPVGCLRLSAFLKGRGWRLADEDGALFDLTDLDRDARWAMITAVNRGVRSG